MANGFGGLIGGLLGIAILATVAGSILGKGASTVWHGAKEVRHKIPKSGGSMWW